jgi:predicted N-acetyltransferase YhbS
MATVREERPADGNTVHVLNREVFGRDAEADLVDRLRANG